MSREIENKIKEFIPEKHLDEHLKSYIAQAMQELARERAIGFQNFVSEYENSIQAKRFFNVETDDQLYYLYLSQLKEKL